jgi:hypothetical protein
MDEKSTENLLKFRKALRDTFATESGKDVLEFLRRVYVESPALDASPELTYYKLGQKEFVQGLIKDSSADLEELEKLVKGG